MKETYRIDEIADKWDVDPRTVRRRIARGEIDAFKVGDTWRIPGKEIDRYERENSSKKD